MEEQTIAKLYEKEKKAELYDERCLNFPVWRLYRRLCRVRYLEKHIPGYKRSLRKRNLFLFMAVILKN